MSGAGVLYAEGLLASEAAAHARPAEVQVEWERWPLARRLRVLRRARQRMAEGAETLAEAISGELERSRADTLVAEVLPLLAACRYLERSAAAVLRTRRDGAAGRPLWLGRVTSETERVALGRVLVIGPANYPLLLPGVQVLQALAAGNAVVWKPGRGGGPVAQAMAARLREAGLPDGLLRVTDESAAAGQAAIAEGPDKIFFTGSGAVGREVLRRAAEQAIPCVVELSGADAAIVLPSARLEQVVRALGFGLRLNGSATCMAPRRVLLVNAAAERRSELEQRLRREIKTVAAVRLPRAMLDLVTALLQEAREDGAEVIGGEIDGDGRFFPALVLGGQAEMRLTQTDVSAPVLTVIEVQGMAGVLAAQAACPMALTASIFGEERAARALAARLKVGHVSLNDLIVPTADPRVPFSGRKASGFGATRGAEGLLEMTAPRVIAVRRGSTRRQYAPTGATHVGLFAGLASWMYGGTTGARLHGLTRMVRSARAIAQADAMKRSGDVQCE